MNENEEVALRMRLDQEENARNRGLFNYTFDALPYMMTYPQSHDDVKRVIFAEIDYDNLPLDVENEMYKGFAFKDQADIVEKNQGRLPLCEALGMQGCIGEECPIYIAPGSKDSKGNVITTVPLCREFKLAFKK